MATISQLDPTRKPPESLRAVHKFYQQASIDDLAGNTDVLDLGTVQTNNGDPRLSVAKTLDNSDLANVFALFDSVACEGDGLKLSNVNVYEHPDFPGKSPEACNGNQLH